MQGGTEYLASRTKNPGERIELGHLLPGDIFDIVQVTLAITLKIWMYLSFMLLAFSVHVHFALCVPMDRGISLPIYAYSRLLFIW